MDTATKSTAVQLQFPPELVEEIRACSFDGLKALPRRGAEVGGIITFASGSQDTAEELHLVGSEHLYGPSWRLSRSDLSALRDSVLRCEAEGKPAAAWFRSCTRNEMNVEPDDQEAIGFACPEVPFVVIAKPAMNGSAQIRIFGREPDGGWSPVKEEYVASPVAQARSEKPQLANGHVAQTPVPQRAAPQVSLPQVPMPQISVPTSPLPNGISHDSPASPATEGRSIHDAIHEMRERALARHQAKSELDAARTQGLRPSWIVLAAALIFLLAAVAFWFRAKTPGLARDSQSPPPAGQAVATPSNDPKLGLAVRDENGKYHVMWSRDSATAKSAISGVLEISDSGALKSIPLLPVDITGGSIVYTPRSSDVVFRLQLRNAEGKPVEEMVRLVGGEPVARSTPAVHAAPAPPKGISVLPGDAPAASSAGRGSLPPSSSATPPPYYRSDPSAAPPRNEPEKAQPAVSSATDTAQKAANQPVTQAPKQTANQPIGQPTGQTTSQAANAANQGSRSEASSGVKADPVQVSQSTSPIESRPAVLSSSAPSTATPSPQAAPPSSKAAAVTAPQPTGRVIPTKRGLNFTLYAPTKIAVLVKVDERGKVSQAIPDSALRGNNAFLVGRALSSAKAWTFKPATRGGKPIPGEYRIEFVFPPD